MINGLFLQLESAACAARDKASDGSSGAKQEEEEEEEGQSDLLAAQERAVLQEMLSAVQRVVDQARERQQLAGT